MSFFTKFKKQNGSITLFTIASMMFFVIVLLGVFAISSSKMQKQRSDMEKIQSGYQQRNVDDMYNKYIEKHNNVVE